MWMTYSLEKAEDDAYVALKRLLNSDLIKNKDARKFFKDVVPKKTVVGEGGKAAMGDTLEWEAHMSWHRAWGGGDTLKRQLDNTVYGVLKKLMLDTAKIQPTKWQKDRKGNKKMILEAYRVGEDARRGQLTGSTEYAISWWLENDYTAAAGIRGGDWPSNSMENELKVPLKDVLIEIKNKGFWKSKMEHITDDLLREIEGTKIAKGMALEYNKQRRTEQTTEMLKEGKLKNQPVIMKWDASKFQIIWPEKAINKLGMHNITVPAEPYATKQYNKGGSGPKNRMLSEIFSMRKYFQDEVYESLKDHIQGIWDGTPPPSRLSRKDTEKEFTTVRSGFEGPEREDFSKIGLSKAEKKLRREDWKAQQDWQKFLKTKQGQEALETGNIPEQFKKRGFGKLPMADYQVPRNVIQTANERVTQDTRQVAEQAVASVTGGAPPFPKWTPEEIGYATTTHVPDYWADAESKQWAELTKQRDVWRKLFKP